MLKEFKEFALRGNMIDLAVGVIIGGAFNSLVTSLVDNIIMPLISIVAENLILVTGYWHLMETTTQHWQKPKMQVLTTLNYGTFISGFINFIIMAFVVFLFVKGINSLRKKSEVPAAPTTKVCPFCKSEIAIDAQKCPHCTSELGE